MSLVQITHTIIINPDHISAIEANQDREDSAYVIYTITMYNGTAYNIRLRDYWNGPQDKWEALCKAFPRLTGTIF